MEVYGKKNMDLFFSFPLEWNCPHNIEEKKTLIKNLTAFCVYFEIFVWFVFLLEDSVRHSF